MVLSPLSCATNSAHRILISGRYLKAIVSAGQYPLREVFTKYCLLSTNHFIFIVPVDSFTLDTLDPLQSGGHGRKEIIPRIFRGRFF